MFSGCIKPTYYDAYIPVSFIPDTGEPKTEVRIDGKSYDLMVDLGSPIYLSLIGEFLEPIDKEFLETAEFIDIKGNRHQVPAYKIAEARIRNMLVRPVGIREESIEFIINGSRIYTSSNSDKKELASQRQGRIGRGILTLSNLFLDFHRSKMFSCSDLYKRRKEGYNVSKFHKVPFENLAHGIIFKAQTDLGPKRLLLDTGATLSILQKSMVDKSNIQIPEMGLPFYVSSDFILGEKNFGTIQLSLYEMPAAFNNIDGIIGMDFLMQHVVYLDFTKNEAWICRASESMNP